MKKKEKEDLLTYLKNIRNHYRTKMKKQIILDGEPSEETYQEYVKIVKEIGELEN